VAYAARLTIEGELNFRVDGAIAVDGGQDRLDIRSIGAGCLRPGADPGLTHGAAVCQVVTGTGRFAGAAGLVTMAFVLSDVGDLIELHLTILSTAANADDAPGAQPGRATPSDTGRANDAVP
jgi:hypothetical protein